jgi:hypothetical protein
MLGESLLIVHVVVIYVMSVPFFSAGVYPSPPVLRPFVGLLYQPWVIDDDDDDDG